MSRFRGGPHGQPYGDLPRDRLVGYIQSHDQVGNRPAGERLHHLAGVRKTMLAAAILMVSPFVPMLFQGEEWAASSPFCYFVQMQSPELREAIRAGRRAEHAMNGSGVALSPDDPALRERSVLRWEERGEPAHAAMLAWYRDLIAARRAHADLRDPSPAATRVSQARGVIAIQRGALRLVCNLTEEPVSADLAGDVILASAALANQRELPPLAVALVRG
jgi:maltooligosyltrehalose trehalohydrolase